MNRRHCVETMPLDIHTSLLPYAIQIPDTIITLGRFSRPSRSPPSSSLNSPVPPPPPALLTSFSVSSVTSSLLPLSKAPVSALSLSPAVLITQSERTAYLPPSLLHCVLLKLLASPEGSLLLPQCTQSLQTTDTVCIHIHI